MSKTGQRFVALGFDRSRLNFKLADERRLLYSTSPLGHCVTRKEDFSLNER